MSIKRTKAKKITAVFFLLLAVSMTFYIIYNGMQDGKKSSKQSETVTQIVEIPLDKAGITYDHKTINHAVRKTAHFTEYMLVSLFACIGFFLIFKKKLIPALAVFGYSATLAAFDEFFLQANAASRSPQFTDILIDCSGAVIGAALAIAALALARKLHTCFFCKKSKQKSF